VAPRIPGAVLWPSPPGAVLCAAPDRRVRRNRSGPGEDRAGAGKAGRGEGPARCSLIEGRAPKVSAWITAGSGGRPLQGSSGEATPRGEPSGEAAHGPRAGRDTRPRPPPSAGPRKRSARGRVTRATPRPRGVTRPRPAPGTVVRQRPLHPAKGRRPGVLSDAWQGQGFMGAGMTCAPKGIYTRNPLPGSRGRARGGRSSAGAGTSGAEAHEGPGRGSGVRAMRDLGTRGGAVPGGRVCGPSHPGAVLWPSPPGAVLCAAPDRRVGRRRSGTGEDRAGAGKADRGERSGSAPPSFRAHQLFFAIGRLLRLVGG
jgi:hypothetical protein